MQRNSDQDRNSPERRAERITPGTTETDRLETFADGVFAIAITLLILEIHIPEEGAHLDQALLNQWPSFLAYVLSFITIGIMWVNHHRMFTLIGRANSTFLLLNVIFLLPVAFVPFPTALIARHILDDGAGVAVVVYGVTMALIALMFDVLFLYAMRRGLLAIELTPESRPRGAWVYQAGPVIYLVGSALAAVSPIISLLIFAALAAFWAIVEVAPRRAE
jgi:TMEM175 potassium channel family protein